jgi:Family of unknown function (DUF6204)
MFRQSQRWHFGTAEYSCFSPFGSRSSETLQRCFQDPRTTRTFLSSTRHKDRILSRSPDASGALLLRKNHYRGRVNVFRVTVRGQFKELTDVARAYLLSTAEEHDLFLSRFTEEGTFTYDKRLQFFNLRYEVREATDGNPEATPVNPELIALREAELFLRTLRITHGPLRAAVMDMTGMLKRR